MNNLSWLSKICHPDYVDDPVLGIFNDIRGRPFSLVVDGRSWAVATNGAMIVAVAGENSFEPPLLDWVKRGSIKVVEDFLSLRSSEAFLNLKLERLKQWCGEPAWGYREKCGTCDGKGWGDDRWADEAARPCPDCDDKGSFVDLPIRRGWIGNVLINREALALGLKPFSDSTVRVAVAGRWDPLIVSGDRWRVVLMPMRGERDPLDPMVRVDEEMVGE